MYSGRRERLGIEEVVESGIDKRRSKRIYKQEAKETLDDLRRSKRHCNDGNDQLLFPDEIYLEILKFLDPADLCNLALVSKRLNLVASDPKLWKDKINQGKLVREGLAKYFEDCELIRFKVIRLRNAPRCPCAFDSCSRTWRTEGQDDRSEVTVTSADFEAILDHLKCGSSKIEELGIDNVDLTHIPPALVAETLTKVKKVNWSTDEKNTEHTVETLRNIDIIDNVVLKELTLSDVDLRMVPPVLYASLVSKLEIVDLYSVFDLAVYGQKYLIIDKEIKKHKFERQPIGPVGRFVRLKAPASRRSNPVLVSLVESMLSAKPGLRTYLCHCDQDRRILMRIFDKVFSQELKPIIVVSRFLPNRHKVYRAKVPVTLMDLLDIRDVTVFNHLVDMKCIESVAVSTNQDEAKFIASHRDIVPKYLANDRGLLRESNANTEFSSS